ncbi:uncharacterized protein BX663DRAFT_529378 [Cokeromyces recurvatus]|uniref:uncharacterized protein n=1 Tax=Cokeromyces recurvatus TaxID=90255 RepID=UPI00221F6654|nr:uncharacterized protein BX663DRAFT_529378 [Cokeromyces recurvatus]KAI7906806.1 hypothetical protein BX663DRAFT_529378 [Cokeromyces recurvatus]
MALLVTILAIIEVVVLSTHYKLLHQGTSSIRIVKRQYPFKTYTHLDTSLQSQLEKGTRVYHVTREFGHATLTNVGKTVTALAAAQQASNLTEVAIIMPFYTFMRKYISDKEIEMVIDIQGNKPGQIMTVEFRVWKMFHVFNPPVQSPSKYEWQIINNVNTSVLITPQRPPQPTDAVPVYMIGHANRRLFNKAFKCRTVEEIYDENELPNEWRDQYFAKAAAAFLAHKATASDEESIFAPIRIVPRVDIVHIHGASNAYLAKFLHEKRDADDLGPRPPAIIYTMHDHDEVQYTNLFRNVKKFLDHPQERKRLYQYVLGGKMYMSQFAIDRADAVTVINQQLASDIVEGRHDFHLKELVMSKLLKKVEDNRFYGINNGVDYHSTDHPFLSDKLVNRSMVFPSYAWDLIKDQELIYIQNLALKVPDIPTYWTLSEHSKDFIYTYKDRAKEYLIKRNLLTEEDMQRPIVLFRGNFESQRRLETPLEEAAKLFAKHNIRFIIMGKRGDYPSERLEALEKQYPNHISIISSAKQQRQLGVFCRAAADFTFTPNSDQDNYTQAEGFIFGSASITPRSGPLKDAIIDRSQNAYKTSVSYLDPESISERGAVVTSYEYYNSYVYDNISSLASAIQDASTDYRKLQKNKALHEEFLLRIIRSAVNLGWDRGHSKGPVHEYNRVYELTLEDRFIPEIRRHEVEQENELVSRLQDID